MNYTAEVENKVLSYIQRYRMLSPQDGVVVGVSGGADSVCLLFVLTRLRERLPLKVTVTHINHCLRPDAETDAEYVRELCGQLKLPFYLQEADIAQVMKAEGVSEEEAGRLVRYRFFAETAAAAGADRIAVAHNRNDQAETMLFNLFRGSGIKGMAGIPPVREQIIRPLLCLERCEIEGYLEEIGVFYQKDSTNQEDKYTRNRIRHHILPYAEAEIVSGTVRHLAAAAEELAATEDYLASQTRAAAEQWVQQQEQELILDPGGISRLHPVIGRRLVLMAIKAAAAAEKDITRQHVQAVLELITREGNREVQLPYELRARREYARVILGRRKPEISGMVSVLSALPLMLPTDIPVGESRRLWLENWGSLECKVMAADNCEYIPQKRYTKWFDYDKMEKSIALRTRREGDYLCIYGGRDKPLGHKKLKTLMIDLKIPSPLRGQLPLLAAGSHCIWLIGHRISEYYKVTKDTKRILQIRVEMQKDGG